MPRHDPLYRRLKQEQADRMNRRSDPDAVSVIGLWMGAIERARQKLDEGGTWMPFDPKAHMSKLKGKDYLEVKWRLVWFREDHPDFCISTECLHDDGKKATFRASISDANGLLLATGHKSETSGDFGDYAEKAETGSIGRALAHLGYGTQFAPDLEEGERIVDSPVGRESPAKPLVTTPEVRTTSPVNLPNQDDSNHPNKTKVTEALCKSIYITGSKIGLTNEDVKTRAGLMFNMPIASLYDLGATQDKYKQLLMELNSEAAQKQAGGNA